MDEAFSTLVDGLDLRLWRGEPADSWLREQGASRVLVIDDQWPNRQSFFDVPGDGPPHPSEKLLLEWLNIELQFFPMPADYSWVGAFPTGTFSNAWFEAGLQELLNDPRPITAVLLDLLFGDKEHGIANASGRRFLSLLRRRLPDVPVLILSNIRENQQVLKVLKGGGERGALEELSSFQDYLPKFDPERPDQQLIERIAHKLVWWADLADPVLSAFSRPMRRLARQMRQVVLRDERIDYETARDTLPRPVILSGGYGTGKNFLASRIVATSRRRASPYHTLNFAGTTDDGVIPTLFGSLMFTGAAECFHVDPTDGSVIARLPAGIGSLPAGATPLGSLGVLHLADIADQPIPHDKSHQQPLRGSVLLDELGTASEKMQTRLLGVLNNGRFAPYLGSQEIPTRRCLDVWFLATVTPETQNKMRDDLRGRLAKGHQLHIPTLAERTEDVLPLTLGRMPDLYPCHPEKVFTQHAVDWLLECSSRFQVRDLIALLLSLPEVSAKRPYGAGELQLAFRLAQSNPSARTFPASAETPLWSRTENDRSDTLEYLARWKSGETVPFPTGLEAKNRMRGQGSLIDSATAALRLAYLELAVAHTEGPTGEVSATRTHQFEYGEPASANLARDRLAAVFEADEAQTKEFLLRSDRLVRLAIEIAKRRKKVSHCLRSLAEDSTQRKRILSLGWESEE